MPRRFKIGGEYSSEGNYGQIGLRSLKIVQNLMIDQNYIKHFFESQQYENSNQLQKDKWKKNKHVGTKQLATKKSMGQWRNQRGNWKIPSDNKNGNNS